MAELELLENDDVLLTIVGEPVGRGATDRAGTDDDGLDMHCHVHSAPSRMPRFLVGGVIGG
ncbi:hypothetical protein EV191_115108 [Tamaricihabitans halophyticus]|uniref:Uncharacterized protein n=1 Tax=Tamaricihabitans halophyticus TaxID=1262583 RepID=A0A4R2QCE3_9PSEU|nr:hypothetical protein [Tamaricihabitans halophyticus]TCP45828.1 hypothetical protein EV191_115108 [Tamaricihabitans halophyticus]